MQVSKNVPQSFLGHFLLARDEDIVLAIERGPHNVSTRYELIRQSNVQLEVGLTDEHPCEGAIDCDRSKRLLRVSKVLILDYVIEALDKARVHAVGRVYASQLKLLRVLLIVLRLVVTLLGRNFHDALYSFQLIELDERDVLTVR